jgi:hypothetical protein
MSSLAYLRWMNRRQRRPPIALPTDLEVQEWAEKLGWVPAPDAANDNEPNPGENTP